MVIALIPARGGSKRIHRKNLIKLGGISLVARAIIAARQVAGIDHTFVSSDKKEILDITLNYSQVSGWRRSPLAASDDATDYDVIKDLLDGISNLPAVQQDKIEQIVYLRPTTPFRTIHEVETAIQAMQAVPEATGLRSVHEMSESAYKCMEVLPGGILQRAISSLQSNRWDVDGANLPNHRYPKTYHPNGVVDIIRPAQIEQGNTFGGNVMAHITQPTIEIDTEWDLQMARYHDAFKIGGNLEVFKT